jgi:hypothetical protein
LHAEHAEHAVGELSKIRGSPEGKEIVSFGTDMTPDEEITDGSSSVKTDLVLAIVVDRFHARKFGAKSEKWGALKVTSTSKVKKQKTPIKASIQGALKQLDPDEMEAMLNRTKSEQEDLMEVVT